MSGSSARLAVLASGSGSNLQAIADACASGRLDATVELVVSDRAGARALTRVPGVSVALPAEPGESRRAYDARLAEVVAAASPDVVVLAGWMRLLSMEFLGRFPGRVVNLHPAMPGELPGTHAIERAYEQFRAGARTSTGVMVHLVPDEGVDDGPVLATAVVPIEPDDTLEALETRVHATEHALLISALSAMITSEAS